MKFYHQSDLVQFRSSVFSHNWFHSLGKIKTSSPGPGRVSLYPPQPFETSFHVSGRDHFKDDSGTDVEAGIHRKGAKLTMKTQIFVTRLSIYS